ncbi:hypothetical protein ASF56_23145 [Methylobacterium sp. Leaf122]|nr:GSU2403 family nucleotidyltransferase fold protein [Methylobacterium sp. Leaf122]KQQ17620.1 hypothetical protein ASF56_23145 [Methylobacterium sp. Leaf122]
MKTLPNLIQIAFADLIAKAFDAEFDDAYPENGRFAKRERRGQEYWYYLGYERDPDGSKKGKEVQKYVGPVADPEITRRVERFQGIRVSYRERREIAGTLRRSGLPAPSPLEGNVVAALARGGLFQMRAVLVGSLAFQTYSGLLGVALKDALYRTEDIDIAQDYGVSIGVGADDRMEEVQEVLRGVEPSFRPVPHIGRNPSAAAFQTAKGFKVEFLTTNRGSPNIESDISMLPALGVGATPLRFLDFLIRHPCRSVLLHDAGVAVMVPTPERYAVHKLIVSRRRIQTQESQEKARKDIAQAGTIIQAKHHLRMSQDIGFAWIEAFERGDTWRQLLEEGAQLLDVAELSALELGIRKAAELEKMPDWKSYVPWRSPA